MEREGGGLRAHDLAHERDCGLGWPTIHLPGIVPVPALSV